MSVNEKDVRKIAKLARLAIADEKVPVMVDELNGILNWIEMLGEVNVEGVEPMTSVVAKDLPMRDDVINDGFIQQQIVKNAPKSSHGFFIVPKSVE